MPTKGLLFVVVFGISAMLMACTPPAGIVPAGFTKQVEFSQDNASTSTEIVQPTKAVEPTETQVATGAAEATDEASRAGCPGNPGGTPPVAATIANTYQVSQDEVMGWFCKGFGFGEIKKAYQWASKTGKLVDELFALRQQGMGWGEIGKSLDIQPGSKPCWAGPDHGASDPNCVKPAGNNQSGEHGNGNGHGSGKGGQGGNGKNGKP